MNTILQEIDCVADGGGKRLLKKHLPGAQLTYNVARTTLLSGVWPLCIAGHVWDKVSV